MSESEEKIQKIIGELEQRIDGQIRLMGGDVHSETRTQRHDHNKGIRFALDKIYEEFPEYRKEESSPEPSDTGFSMDDFGKGRHPHKKDSGYVDPRRKG